MPLLLVVKNTVYQLLTVPSLSQNEYIIFTVQEITTSTKTFCYY